MTHQHYAVIIAGSPLPSGLSRTDLLIASTGRTPPSNRPRIDPTDPRIQPRTGRFVIGSARAHGGEGPGSLRVGVAAVLRRIAKRLDPAGRERQDDYAPVA